MSSQEFFAQVIAGMSATAAKLSVCKQNLAESKDRLRKLSFAIETLESSFDVEVANSPDLKNDQSRKAKKAQLGQDSTQYQTVLGDYRLEQQTSDRLDAELSSLRREYEILRLQADYAVANRQAEAHEMSTATRLMVA